MGSGAFLVSAGRFLAAAWERALKERGDAMAARPVGRRSRGDASPGREPVPVRCGPQPDGGPTGAAFAVAGDAGRRSAAVVSRSSPCGRQQPCGGLATGRARTTSGQGPTARAVAARLAVRVVGCRSCRYARAGGTSRRRRTTPPTSSMARRPRLRALHKTRAWPAGRRRATCGASGGCPADRTDTSITRCSTAALADRRSSRVRSTPRVNGFASRAHAIGCFHWPLEFPEVFLDEEGRPRPDGGFDAVVGNPPWEMLRADARRDAAAAGEGEALVRFARDSGVYAWQGRGHANQFQLFVERALHVTRPGGRVGLIVPASLLTDEGSEPLRRGLIAANQLDTVTVFDNRRALFPIHRSVRFATFTAGRNGRTTAIRCRFGVTDSAAIHATPQVTLTPRLVEQLSGPGLAIPDLPTPADLRLVEALSAAHPALADESGWHVTFGRELNATDDRDCLRDAVRPSRRPAGARGPPPFAVSRGRAGHVPPCRPGGCARAPGRPRRRGPSAAGLSRRRQRDQPHDADCRDRPGSHGDGAHRVLPAVAPGRWMRSACCARCSTATSPTIWCGGA